MNNYSHPVIVTFNGRLYKLSPEKWRTLAPKLKGLNSRERGIVGERFLVEEGIIPCPPVLDPRCSWCTGPQPLDPGQPPTSHRLCRFHAAQLLEES